MGDPYLGTINFKNIPNMDEDDGTLSDPYVKVFLLPGEENGIRTDTVKDDLNPVFNRNFAFMLPRSGESRELVLQVFDSDDNKKNDDEIGEARLLIEVSMMDRTQEYVMPLKPIYVTPPLKSQVFIPHAPHGSAPDDNNGYRPRRGTITYKLAYYPQDNLLKVKVVKCEDLPNLDLGPLGDKSDPYVIVSIIAGIKKHQKTTRVINDNLNPRFDESFEFYDFDHEECLTGRLQFEVFDFDDNETKGDFIGQCTQDIRVALENPGKAIKFRSIHLKSDYDN